MLEDCTSAKKPKSALDEDTILSWIVDASVLSIALEGGIVILSEFIENSLLFISHMYIVLQVTLTKCSTATK